VGFALPRYVCARVWKPAKWACVSGGVFVSNGEFAIVELAVYELSIGLPSLWEFRTREWSVVPTVLVRAPWVLALMMRRM